MSKISKKSPDRSYRGFGDHKKYISRISKTLYHGKVPKTDCLSLPVTELASELFSEAKKGKSLERLHLDDAAKISRNACVSPCALVLAMLYLERLKKCNPSYLEKTAPSDLFLVSLMVSSKFLFDDGEMDEVFVSQWAASGGISVKALIQMEKQFLNAIDWKIYVSEIMFWKKLNELETTLARRQGTARGHFTYTELQNLSSTIEINAIINCIVSVSVILAATYLAGLLTLVGSMFLASQIPGTYLQSKKAETFAPNKTIETCNSGYNIEKETNYYRARKMDALDVFKTGFLLASINTINVCNNTSQDIRENANCTATTWDWWTVPTMTWLSKTSELVGKKINQFLPFYLRSSYIETTASNLKHLNLEDQIHKATKTRIQDQLETSWHEEWTDTINYGLFYERIVPYFIDYVKY